MTRTSWVNHTKGEEKSSGNLSLFSPLVPARIDQKNRSENRRLCLKMYGKNIPAIPKNAGYCYPPLSYRSTAWPVLSPVSRGDSELLRLCNSIFFSEKMKNQKKQSDD
jgi:hypothetical protein